MQENIVIQAEVNRTFLSLLHRLWLHMSHRRRKQFVSILALTVIAAFFEMVTIGAVLPFLLILSSPTTVMDNPNARFFVELFGATDRNDLLLMVTLTFIIAIIAACFFRMTLMWTHNQFSSRIAADLSIRIYRHTLYQPYAVHISKNSSEVIGGIMIKANSAISHIFSKILVLISSGITIIFIVTALFYIHLVAALTALVGFSVVYVLIIRLTKARLERNSKDAAHQIDRAMRILQESLGGIRDIIIDGSQETFCKIYNVASLRLRLSQASSIFIEQSPKYLIEASGIILISLVAFYLAHDMDGFGAVLPLLGALALGAQRMMPAAQQAYSAWSSIVADRSNLAIAVDLLDQPITEPGSMLQLPVTFDHDIRLDSVSFKYASNSPLVLSAVDLSFKKGARVGFIGETGCGKSTLLDIVMGILLPTDGHLMVDGELITSENRRAWQRLISHVPQMIFLADSSIAENIAFGLPADEIDMDRVRMAAKQATISEVIEAWPNGYQTVVGERGIRLSGGQRQRIGIARALYKKSSVIIFDEATSALDNQTESSVMRAIEGLGRDITIFIIAHRLSTLSICDEIIEIGSKGIMRKLKYSDISKDS